MKLYQQGDCLLSSTESMSGGNIVPAKNGWYVLAEGEKTGNAHRIEAVADVEFIEKDGMFYLKNKKPCIVKHEEHRPITIPPGFWRVSGVREYDHFLEEARRVAD